MGKIKLRRFRKVMFTDSQMLVAKNSGKFPDQPGLTKLQQHRPFVEWLFKTQHKCLVLDHTRLKYNYMTRNKISVIEIEGELGSAIGFM